MWTGTYNNYSGRPWYFGQFDDAVLPACCFILQNSRLKGAERGNPVKVSRAISAMVIILMFYNDSNYYVTTFS